MAHAISFAITYECAFVLSGPYGTPSIPEIVTADSATVTADSDTVTADGAQE